MISTPEGKLEDRVLVPSITRKPEGPGGTVTTNTSEQVPYDVLVLASGSHWEGGLDLPDLRKDAIPFIDTWREKIKASKGVAIVGGGAVGSELAGEIRDVFPDKKITIIHKQSHLLSSVYPDKFRTDVDNRWTRRQILLNLGDQIDEIPEFPATSVVTSKGTRVEADLVIPARGGRPNTAYVASLDEGVLTADGHVKVDRITLQVVGHLGVFAAGDITDLPEVKQVAKYPNHVTAITANILSYLDGKPLAAKYKPLFEGILLTNGASGGAIYMDILWGITFGNWVTKTLKSADLFITKTRKDLGYV